MNARVCGKAKWFLLYLLVGGLRRSPQADDAERQHGCQFDVPLLDGHLGGINDV